MCCFDSVSIGISSHVLLSVEINHVLISICLESCVDLVLWYNLDNLMLRHSFVCLLGLLGVLSKLYLPLVLGSLKHAYLLYVFTLSCFLSLTQYIGETPPSLKLDEMCMDFIFINWYPYAHIHVEFVLCVVGSLTLWSQWVWVPFCLWCCSRNNWRCIGCSAHSQGRCCHHVLFGVKLGWSTNYFLLPSIGIYYFIPMLSR